MSEKSELVVTHKFKVEAVSSFEEETVFEVFDASLNLRKSRLTVTYDVSAINLDVIFGVLGDFGISLHKSWWANCRYGWAKQIDQNILDNVTHTPHCCSKAPKIKKN